jgi:uncharacterized SAM-binding protein YcdF (DUF218 family)
MFGLGKFLSPFLTPLGGGLVLLALALILIGLRRVRSATALVLVVFVGLYAGSMPLVAERLSGVLEAQFPPQPIASIPAADVIVLLGGAVDPALPPRQAPELNEHADRLMLAADLYRAGKAPVILASGGEWRYPSAHETEAADMRDILVRFGVPPAAIVLEDGSDDTAGNARLSATLMAQHGWHTALLVTSALHMPRALASFRRAGISPTPATTDIVDAPSPDWPLLGVVPTTTALQQTGDALHELVGMLYYRLRGWA